MLEKVHIQTKADGLQSTTDVKEGSITLCALNMIAL
jgi:hypothetical protein